MYYANRLIAGELLAQEMMHVWLQLKKGDLFLLISCFNLQEIVSPVLILPNVIIFLQITKRLTGH